MRQLNIEKNQKDKATEVIIMSWQFSVSTAVLRNKIISVSYKKEL